MRGTVFSRLRLGATKLLRDQRGNAFMLTAAAIVPVIGIVGSAVDIGRAYMTQLRLQQACDSGVLAGRRAMASGTYTDEAKAEASKMFNFNFPEEKYGATGIGFSSRAPNGSDVEGSASAVLPTALMYMFGKDEFRLSASCTAKLEISNVDVMMVLDVTGSMRDKAVSTDTDTKIVALRAAAIDFFDTLTSADVGDGRLRFGVVPYSSSVNVGQILIGKDSDWIANTTLLPSRTPVFRYENAETSTGTEYVESPQVPEANWHNDGSNNTGEADCPLLSPTANTTSSPSGQPNYNQTGRYEDGAGKRVTTYDRVQTYVFRTYRYAWTGNPRKCRNQYKEVKFTRTYITTTVDYRSDIFEDKYIYEDRNFDVTAVKDGDPLETDTGEDGETVSVSWDGCIIERATTPFAANETAPSTALDMDIDLVPTTDGENATDTQWRMFLPAVAFRRSSQASSTESTNKSSFAALGGDTAACPVAAMNMATKTAADLETFSDYIETLQPKGFTYHDAGMAWGARLISPTGLFATENAPPINGRPVSRHILFMTDGDMNTPPDNLSHQGLENTMKRIGATGSGNNKLANAIARHNNRFVQLCRAARARGITVWVVSFGVGANTNLNNCASSGQAFEASNSEQLNDQFQAIARQISKLRLSQ